MAISRTRIGPTPGAVPTDALYKSCSTVASSANAARALSRMVGSLSSSTSSIGCTLSQ
ncbi:MAG TPA: hypothetical protein PKZ76_15805 [Xanthomonadaceae bacterium]|nr:hypothetical protein [Xanthomonadaceae bacterium]